MSLLFFTFGRLNSNPTSSESYSTITDFIVASALLIVRCGQYMMHGIEAEEGDEVDWIGEERFETPLKPLRSNTWGNLPGLDGRFRMAKLAESIYNHVFAASERINWTIDGEQWGPNEIPVSFPAEKALSGPVTSLTNASQKSPQCKNLETFPINNQRLIFSHSGYMLKP